MKKILFRTSNFSMLVWMAIWIILGLITVWQNHNDEVLNYFIATALAPSVYVFCFGERIESNEK